MKRRIAIKVAHGTSKEDMQRIISEAMGGEVDISHFNYDEVVTREKLQVKEIIEPFYSQLSNNPTRNNLEKIDELIDLGKFLHKVKEISNYDIRIVECDSEMIPDFVVAFQGNLVGIEHTRLVDDSVINEVNGLKRVLKEAREILSSNNSQYRGLFNVFFKSSEPLYFHSNYRNLPRAQRRAFIDRRNSLPKQVARYIQSALLDEQQLIPDYLDRIAYTNSQNLEIELGEDYLLKELTEEKILSRMLPKENIIENYKQAKNLEHCWLFMVIDGVSAKSSFELQTVKLPTDHSSPFDQIIIFNNFTREFLYSIPGAN